MVLSFSLVIARAKVLWSYAVLQFFTPVKYTCVCLYVLTTSSTTMDCHANVYYYCTIALLLCPLLLLLLLLLLPYKYSFPPPLLLLSY